MTAEGYWISRISKIRNTDLSLKSKPVKNYRASTIFRIISCQTKIFTGIYFGPRTTLEGMSRKCYYRISNKNDITTLFVWFKFMDTDTCIGILLTYTTS